MALGPDIGVRQHLNYEGFLFTCMNWRKGDLVACLSTRALIFPAVTNKALFLGNDDDGTFRRRSSRRL